MQTEEEIPVCTFCGKADDPEIWYCEREWYCNECLTEEPEYD